MLPPVNGFSVVDFVAQGGVGSPEEFRSANHDCDWQRNGFDFFAREKTERKNIGALGICSEHWLQEPSGLRNALSYTCKFRCPA
jgi:hypothetical protein